MTAPSPPKKAATCYDCGRSFEKPNRATLRRSLRRHFVHNHGETEADAYDLAMEAVPPAPPRSSTERQVRSVQPRRRRPRVA